MASLYLLDTNILIAAMKGRPEVRKRLEAQQISAIRLSAIVMGELEFGAEKSAYGHRNRARLATLTQRLPNRWSASTRTQYGIMQKSVPSLSVTVHPLVQTTPGSQHKLSPSTLSWSQTMSANSPVCLGWWSKTGSPNPECRYPSDMVGSRRFQPAFQVSVWNGLIKYHRPISRASCRFRHHQFLQFRRS